MNRLNPHRRQLLRRQFIRSFMRSYREASDQALLLHLREVRRTIDKSIQGRIRTAKAGH